MYHLIDGVGKGTQCIFTFMFILYTRLWWKGIKEMFCNLALKNYHGVSDSTQRQLN